MGDLTRNLSRYEFACGCGCGFDTVDFFLPGYIQSAIDYFQVVNPEMDVGAHINSGARCVAHNQSVGGGKSSQHLYGKAADFYLFDKLTGDHIDDDEVADYLEFIHPDDCGIGRYKGRTHLDDRATKARWDNR